MKIKKIKILIIIDFIYGLTGGTENQLIKIINNIDSDKFEIYLMSLRKTLWLQSNIKKLRCKYFGYNYNHVNQKDIGNILIFLRMIKDIKFISPDISIQFYQTSYIVGVVASKLAGVKNIISTRRDYGLWFSKWNRLPLRFCNLMVSGFITNSYKVRDLTAHIEKISKSRIIVIYNGYEDISIQGGKNDGLSIKKKLSMPLQSKVVGILAGLRPMKHHKTFLNAAKKISLLRNDVEFIVIGDGPLRDELESYAKDISIANKIYFVGWQENVAPYLNTLDIGVNCSANEGLSNAIMEYMAFDVPCVVSKSGGNDELIEHDINGYVYELDDDTKLAEYVIRLLEDKKKCNSFTKEAKIKIKTEFHMNKMINAYEDYFAALASEQTN